MKDTMLKLYVKAQNLLSSDEGQDLVEYALVIALIALAATAGMNALASDISAAFTTVGTTINTDV
ncbi:MAG: Flp family type IVb pilin [Terracidiphilus sp.]